MNKYQEALYNLCKKCEKNINSIPVQTKENETYDIHHCGYQMCPYRTISNDHCEEYDTLKELIANYDKLEKELSDYRNIGILYIDDNGETSIKLYDKNYKLGSTLNRNAIPKKACDDQFMITDWECKDKLKEWILKDE